MESILSVWESRSISLSTDANDEGTSKSDKSSKLGYSEGIFAK